MAFRLTKTLSPSWPGWFYTLLGVRDLVVVASREVLLGTAELTARARRVRAGLRGVPGWVLDVLAAQDQMAAEPGRAAAAGLAGHR